MNICKNPEDGLNFLEVHWLESESSDGAVQVSEVIHLEYIKPLPPFVILDTEDAFDFAPTSIFNIDQTSNPNKQAEEEECSAFK